LAFYVVLVIPFSLNYKPTPGAGLNTSETSMPSVTLLF
jgi:hypothetical protein